MKLIQYFANHQRIQITNSSEEDIKEYCERLLSIGWYVYISKTRSYIYAYETKKC